MALGAGYKSRCGIAKETVWGTVVAPAELLPFRSETINETTVWGEKEDLVSKAGRRDADILGNKTAGGLVVSANHQETDLLWALIMGGGGAVPTGAGPYVHTLSLSEDITKSASLHFEKDVIVHSIGGCKPTSASLIVEPGDVRIETDFVAKARDRSTTHRAALAALTPGEKPDLLYHNAVLRIADLVDALQVSDAIDVSSLTLAINHNLAVDDRSTTVPLYIEEPYRSGRREITLSLTMPRFTADTFFTWWAAGTLLQADLTVTSGTYIFKAEMSTLMVKEVSAPIGGAELIPVTITLQCYRNRGNTFITETEELELTITNDRSTAIWA